MDTKICGNIMCKIQTQESEFKLFELQRKWYDQKIYISVI